MPIDPVHLKSSFSTPLVGQGRVAGSSTGTAPLSGSRSASAVERPEVSLALEGVDASPTFDAGRVAQIRAAIADGSFQVDAEAVAEGLIATVRELIRNNPRQA